MKQEIINESFDYIYDMIRDFMGTSNSYKGIKLWKEQWSSNKSWMMPYFGEDGRNKLVLPASSQAISEDDIFEVKLVMRPFLENLLLKEPYSNLKPITTSTYVSEHLRYENIIESLVFSTLSPDEIVTNKLKSNVYLDGKVINAGTKSFKALQLYLKEKFQYYTGIMEIESSNYADDLKVATKLLETYYSQVVSSIKQKESTVALSINPVDIFLASKHTSRWSSCHNPFGGAYSTGPISYMLDDKTAISYAYSRTSDYSIFGNIPNLPVKLWRQMVFFNKETGHALHSREYPSIKPLFEQAAAKLSTEVLCKEKNIIYDENKINTFKAYDADGKYTRRHFIIYGAEWHYTDNAVFMVGLEEDNPDKAIVFEVGEEYIPCVTCGELRENVNSELSAHLDCQECGNYSIEICADCEDYIDGEVYYAFGDAYCGHCFNENFIICEDCDGIENRDYAYYIEGSDIYVCERCAERNYIQCDHCGELVYHEDVTEISSGEFLCSYCLDANTMECDNCGEILYTHCLQKTDDTGEYLCEDCLEVCSECNEYVSELSEDDLCEACEKLLAKKA